VIRIRVVFDTNIFVSALNFGGPPRALLLAASSGAFPLFSSSTLEAELLEVLRQRFEWEPQKLGELRSRLNSVLTLVEPSSEVSVCSDPDDNRVLECALACGASHIVTGDAALLQLDPFREIRIVRPASFLAERPWATDESE
jgi:putative PIN family toxin of toxin-antitoxin system